MLGLKKSSQQWRKEWKVLGFSWSRLSDHIRKILCGQVAATDIAPYPHHLDTPQRLSCRLLLPLHATTMMLQSQICLCQVQGESTAGNTTDILSSCICPLLVPSFPSLRFPCGTYIPQTLYIMGCARMTSTRYGPSLWLPNIPHIFSPFVSLPHPPHMSCLPPCSEHFQWAHPAPSRGYPGGTLSSPFFLPRDHSSEFREKQRNRKPWKEENHRVGQCSSPG